jgi:hypothetical protein
MAGQIPTKGAPGQRKSTATKAPAKAPGKTIAKAADDDKVLTLAQAELLTTAIKKADDNLANKIIASFTGRIWEAYGLKDWAEYAAQHLADAQISSQLRKALVPQLVKARMANRAIAAGLKVNEKTIRNDLAEAKKAEDELRNNSADQEPPLDVDEASDSEVTNGSNGSAADEGELRNNSAVDDHAGMRQGSDGKWRPESKPPQEPKAPDLVGIATKIAIDLDAVRIRLDKIIDASRATEHERAVEDALRQAASDMRDSVEDLLTELEPAIT